MKISSLEDYLKLATAFKRQKSISSLLLKVSKTDWDHCVNRWLIDMLSHSWLEFANRVTKQSAAVSHNYSVIFFFWVRVFTSLTLGPVNPTPGSPLGPAAPIGPILPWVNRHRWNHWRAVRKRKRVQIQMCFFFHLFSLKTCTRSPNWTRVAWRPLVTLERQYYFQCIL